MQVGLQFSWTVIWGLEYHGSCLKVSSFAKDIPVPFLTFFFYENDDWTRSRKNNRLQGIQHKLKDNRYIDINQK